MQLAQAIGEAAFEKSLCEKVTQENTSCRWEVGKLRQQLEVRCWQNAWKACRVQKTKYCLCYLKQPIQLIVDTVARKTM